ncbi:MAG: NERD domain-containing protein [Clostridia bacterium]|nr:NERD domain-containing protein [Clostridia bacterium]
MKVVLPLFIIVIVGLAAYLIQKAIRSSKETELSGPEAYGQECERLVYGLMRSNLPSKSVFQNLYFPVAKDGRTLWTETDTVCVTRGGVIAVEVKGAKGVIEDPPEGDWTQRYGEKVLSFHNPYEQNKGHVIAVKKALARDGISGVPVYNVVVFTDRNARFTNKYPWLMHAEKAVDFATLLDDKPVLDKKMIKAVREALSDYTERRAPTAAMQYR